MFIDEFYKNYQRLAEYEYRDDRGIIVGKPIDGAEVRNWLKVGEVLYGKEKYKTPPKGYIFVYPNAEQTDKKGRDSFITDNCSINFEPDGSDGGHYFWHRYDSRFDKIKIYPEYEGTFYDYIITGNGSKYKDTQHNILTDKLFKVGDTVILHHNSNYKITDGVLRTGMKPNPWTKPGDWGIYFWASKNSGMDQSGGGQYTYYCKIKADQLYDITYDNEHMDPKAAARKYGYVYGKWDRGDAAAVQTLTPTPIWVIKDNSTGQFYDPQWNKIETPSILK